MYSIMQICAIIFFFISFIPPFWIWGHLLAIIVFFVASHMARSAKRQQQMLEAMQQNKNVENKDT